MWQNACKTPAVYNPVGMSVLSLFSAMLAAKYRHFAFLPPFATEISDLKPWNS